MPFSNVMLCGGLLKQRDMLEAAANSCGKSWRPVLREEQVNKCTGKNEFKKCCLTRIIMMPNFRLVSEN